MNSVCDALPPSAQHPFSTALLDPEQACPAGLTTWNGSDPTTRFNVYRNNVVTSLVNALADTCPVVQALVGEEFFRAMARVFVQRSPPSSPILAHYGLGFAAFVRDFAPAQSVPYLADMARLEVARVQAYHAADADVISGDALSQAMSRADAVAQLRVAWHPSVQLLRSRFAVVSLWAAHQGEFDLGHIDPLCAEDALVVRSALEVQVVLLDPGAAVFVQSLMQLQPLGEATAQTQLAYAAFDLSACLALLLRLGAITSLY